MARLACVVLALSSVLGQGFVSQLPCDQPSAESAWEHVGPGGYYDKDDPLKISSSGAAQAAVHLGNTSWLLAVANGGIWKTSDLLTKTANGGPQWSQVLDGQPVSCTSISAMESMGSTVLAGCGGATSAELGQDWNVVNTGDWGGVMVSQDAGTTWAMTLFPVNYFVTAFVVHSASSWVVSARSHFYDNDDGGVWFTTSGGKRWKRTFHLPVFDLAFHSSSGALFAAVPWSQPDSTIWASPSGGTKDYDFIPVNSALSWGGGRLPFYLQFAIGKSNLFIGGLTVLPKNLSNTSSAVSHRPISDLVAAMKNGTDEGFGNWTTLRGGPDRLDLDGMPKDRMALLVHPANEDMLFVAGNADALVYRSLWKNNSWTTSSGKPDTTDGSEPHGDCRRYFWEPTTNSLVLLSDGGAFLREKPDKPGGKWRSLSGDIGAMEMTSADWDPVGHRWVGGAQDNSVQVAPIGTNSSSCALGVVGGDGSVTAVDAAVHPPRLWGATQFLGNVLDTDGPQRTGLGVEDDDCAGFGFYQGDKYICIPLPKWFKVSQFQYFVQPLALHSIDPTRVFFYARATDLVNPGHIYEMKVPYSVKNSSDIAAPTHLDHDTRGIQMMVAGGMTDGKNDSSVIVAMNSTHILHRSSKSDGKFLEYALPQEYTEPVSFVYPTNDYYILGPVSHFRTITLAVSPSDSQLIAVTGYETIDRNYGTERIWLSKDGGASFTEITYNIKKATGTIGQVRPSALLLVPVAKGATAVLVGTTSGVFVSFTDGDTWTRFGDCSKLPLVLVLGLSYQKASDTVVAATFGRGVYVVHQAKELLESIHSPVIPSPDGGGVPVWLVILIVLLSLLLGAAIGAGIMIRNKKKHGSWRGSSFGRVTQEGGMSLNPPGVA